MRYHKLQMRHYLKILINSLCYWNLQGDSAPLIHYLTGKDERDDWFKIGW